MSGEITHSIDKSVIEGRIPPNGSSESPKPTQPIKVNDSKAGEQVPLGAEPFSPYASGN